MILHQLMFLVNVVICKYGTLIFVTEGEWTLMSLMQDNVQIWSNSHIISAAAHHNTVLLSFPICLNYETKFVKISDPIAFGSTVIFIMNQDLS